MSTTNNRAASYRHHTPCLFRLLPTQETTKMSAIESYLPKVDSPLFHHAVEQVASIWEANPTASYEQVIFQYLVLGLLSVNPDDEDAWYEHAPPSETLAETVFEEQSTFVPNVASDAVVSFCGGKFPHQRVPDCRGHNLCQDPTCQFFHGPLCEFHAGMKVHFGGRFKGQKMTCGKGVNCPFDHASAEMRAARVAAGVQQKRLRYAPSLRTEADILSVFPTLEWRFADVYTYGGLSAEEMDLLEICLERSPELSVVPLEGGLLIQTSDFMDARFMEEMEVPRPPVNQEDGWVSPPSRRR